MRARRLFAAVLVGWAALSTAACTPPPGPPVPEPLEARPAPGDLRVMTWNLLGAQGDDRVLDEHGGWARRLDQLRPDVVVVQEAQTDDLVALLSRTGSPPGTGWRLATSLWWECDAKPSPEGVAILVRADLAVSGTGRTHVGDSCTNPSVRRVLVWATIETTGGPVTVYGTHLTAGSGPAAASRDLQIRRIRALIARHDADRGGGRRWLLAGDVNTAPGGNSYALLTGGEAADGLGPLLDTAAEAEPAAGDPAACPVVGAADTAGLAGLWADPARVRRCGYTAGWPKDDNPLGCEVLSLCTSWQERAEVSVRERIDVVLRAEGSPFAVVDAFVPGRLDDDWAAVGSEWFVLSDHLPYVVDLDVGAAAVAAP